MTINYKDFGQRVRNARKQHHMTQEQLAEIIGISTSFMGHIERGTRTTSIETLVALCNVLEVSPDQLLCASLNQYDSYMPSNLDKETRQRLSQFLRLAQDTMDSWVD